MRQLSLDNFRKWMDDHPEAETHLINKESIVENRLIGCKIESKLPIDRLIKKIVPENDELLENIVEDFSNNGGKIIDIKDNRFIIEVNSGSFELHKCYVKRI